MSIKTRFTLWVLAIIALLAGSPFAFVLVERAASPPVRIGCLAVLWALTGAVALLILTTPANAIRLSPRRSILCLGLGTAWLAFFACVHPDQHLNATARAHGIGEMIGLTLASTALCLALVRRRSSPWWTAVLAWNPAAIGPLALPPGVTACILLVTSIVIVGSARGRRPV